MTLSTKPDPQQPGTRMGRDWKQVRDGARMTAADLKEFMQGLRGKRPTEVLGAVAASGLVQATIQATLAIAVLVAVMTVVPYLLWGPIDQTAKKAVATAATETTPEQSASNANAAPAPAANAAEGETASQNNAPGTEAQRAQQVLEKLDETATITADPNVNPLDIDNLLDEDSTRSKR